MRKADIKQFFRVRKRDIISISFYIYNLYYITLLLYIMPVILVQTILMSTFLLSYFSTFYLLWDEFPFAENLVFSIIFSNFVG